MVQLAVLKVHLNFSLVFLLYYIRAISGKAIWKGYISVGDLKHFS
jgi:hypothetical protein